MITKEKVSRVEVEIQRLSTTISLWRDQMKKYGDGYLSHPKETGAIKRASMDLTRALAELRKP